MAADKCDGAVPPLCDVLADAFVTEVVPDSRLPAFDALDSTGVNREKLKKNHAA